MAKLPRVRFHDLRHSAASLLIAAGVELVQVSQLLGHSELRVTADLYSHLQQQTAARAARDLEDARDWLEACHGPEAAARQFTRLDALARALTIKHASLIRALAVELDTRRRMTGEALVRFIQQHQELVTP